MLAKLTRGNQLTIPKKIVEQADLQAGRDYLEVVYIDGIICLKPVEVKERISPEAYERFLKRAFAVEKGDILVSGKKADTVLRKRMKR